MHTHTHTHTHNTWAGVRRPFLSESRASKTWSTLGCLLYDSSPGGNTGKRIRQRAGEREHARAREREKEDETEGCDRG